MKHLDTPSVRRRPAFAVLGLVTAAAFAAIAGACAEPSSPVDAEASAARVSQRSELPVEASVGDRLGKLRSVTARFHNIQAANDAEYSIPLTGCMVDPTLGGMGFHFGKGGAIDGTVNELEPEVLLYEPEQNGNLRLVAVEFIVPYAFAPREGPAPEAFGQKFLPNDAEGFKLWMLHAWIWKNNPSGMFASWNPEVNCDAVPAAARMSHGH
jgi:hypothetical protein